MSDERIQPDKSIGNPTHVSEQGKLVVDSDNFYSISDIGKMGISAAINLAEEGCDVTVLRGSSIVAFMISKQRMEELLGLGATYDITSTEA